MNNTSMSSRSGTREWIFQRFSNVLIIVYAIVYIYLLLSNSPLTYETLVAMHSVMWFKLYSSFTLVVVMLNALLAGWQIGTDYTQKVPMVGFDKIYTFMYVVPTAIYLAAGMYILWWLV